MGPCGFKSRLIVMYPDTDGTIEFFLPMSAGYS
jgi:hypothetical protein